MAAVNAPHGGRLRSMVAVGFVLGTVLAAVAVFVAAHVAVSGFSSYLVFLGGAMGALVVVSAAAAIGFAEVRGRVVCTLVVSGLGASVASLGIGYLVVVHPPGDHLLLVGLASLLVAGGWGAWQAHRGIVGPAAVAVGLGLSAFVTIALFALTWAVGVFCMMVGV